jgi:hypothetical protein
VGTTDLAASLGCACVGADPALPAARRPSRRAARRETRPLCQVEAVDEFGNLPFERRSVSPFQLVARRCERGAMLITTNQAITQ